MSPEIEIVDAPAFGSPQARKDALAELRDMYPASILVDSGDVFSETPEWTKFEYLQRAYAAMEYDAIAIGDTIGVDVPDRVRTLEADGALGRKADRGFYAYVNGRIV